VYHAATDAEHISSTRKNSSKLNNVIILNLRRAKSSLKLATAKKSDGE
jgi:hypothetical protein